jgi:hypothetical protein
MFFMRNKSKKIFFSSGVLLAALGMVIFFQQQKPPLKDSEVNLKSVSIVKRVTKSASPEKEASKAISLNPSQEEAKNFGPSLTDTEKKQFYTELTEFFSKIALSTLDKEALKPRLSKLNERGAAGVNAIVETLEQSPQSDDDVESRLPMIDYLVYKSRFDSQAKEQLEKLASKPIENSVPVRYRAMLLADRAELLGGLAGIDWDKAAKIIASTKDKLQRSLMANEAYYNLVARGTSSDHAVSLIKEVHPNFNPNS